MLTKCQNFSNGIFFENFALMHRCINVELRFFCMKKGLNSINLKAYKSFDLVSYSRWKVIILEQPRLNVYRSLTVNNMFDLLLFTQYYIS